MVGLDDELMRCLSFETAQTTPATSSSVSRYQVSAEVSVRLEEHNVLYFALFVNLLVICLIASYVKCHDANAVP